MLVPFQQKFACLHRTAEQYRQYALCHRVQRPCMARFSDPIQVFQPGHRILGGHSPLFPERDQSADLFHRFSTGRHAPCRSFAAAASSFLPCFPYPTTLLPGSDSPPFRRPSRFLSDFIIVPQTRRRVNPAVREGSVPVSELSIEVQHF